MILDHLPALQVVVPLLGAVLVALVRHHRLALALTLAVCWSLPLIALGLLARVLSEGPISYALGGWAPPVGIEYRVDAANALILVLVSVMAALVATYAPRSLAADIPADRRGWYYTMYLLCVTGLAGILITGDAFNAFVFLEISSLSSYVLIALGRDRRALLAAYQYLIFGTIGATFYVIGVGLVFALSGSLNLVDIASRINAIEHLRPMLAAVAFITVGVSLKLALFPLHAWLPNAYAYAPTIATAFLASTATKVAVYLLLRFTFNMFGGQFVFGALPMAPILIALSVAAMFVASLVAIFQSDLKRMLAYSSVAQIGYITLGMALASKTGLTAAIVHLLNHALVKGGLFLAVGCIVFRTGLVDIDKLAGIGRRMPWTMAAFVICGMGLVGVPGTVGFVSKWYLVSAALEAGSWLLAFLIVASSLIAVVYVGRIVELAWFREPLPAASGHIQPLPLEMVAVTWIMAVATIWFGIDADFTASLAAAAADAFLGRAP